MWWEQYGKDKMEQYLSAYQDLTGKSFFKHFWSKEDYDLYDIFSWLAELELLCPLSLLEEYLSECSSGREQADEKWVFMAKYLITYMKGLQTPKAVEMLFRIVEEIGISDKGLFGVEDLLLESVSLSVSYRGLAKSPKLRALPQKEFEREHTRLTEKAAEYELPLIFQELT